MNAKLIALAVAALTLISAAPAAAAIDPERNLSTPTGWHWWRGQTAAKLKEREQVNGERVIALNVDQVMPLRLSAALVRNEGAYARDGRWFFDKTRDEVVALTKDKGRRLVDLEPYERFGQQLFAGVTVPNTGKFWWWNYGLTAEQVTADINKHGIRLVDLSVHKRNGQRRFAYVGIRNTGEDASAWWWYFNVSPEFVQQRATEHGARLIDIERHRSGKLTVVMVRNTQNVFTRHAYNVTQGWLNRYVQSQGVRITDLERHGDRYWATMIDNVDAETGRIRSILRSSAYRQGYFGAFSKRVNGPTYVGLAHHASYQPMSVMKLVPLLYTMDLLDKGEVSLDSDSISWQSFQGNPDAGFCPTDAGMKQDNSALLRKILQDALRQSNNRAHEVLLNEYDPATMTERVQQLGLTGTEMYYGCKHTGLKDWWSSRTTLAEMGELFEGVETKAFFPNNWKASRDEFYGIMATWGSDMVRGVVEDEAAKLGKSGVVDSFMAKVEIKAKGGGMHYGDGNGGLLAGRALSYRLLLPVRVKVPLRGRLVPLTLQRPFVGGFFGLDVPAPCSEDDAKEKPDEVSQECRDWAKAMGDTFVNLTAEPNRIPIRQALQTW